MTEQDVLIQELKAKLRKYEELDKKAALYVKVYKVCPAGTMPSEHGHFCYVTISSRLTVQDDIIPLKDLDLSIHFLTYENAIDELRKQQNLINLK